MVLFARLTALAAVSTLLLACRGGAETPTVGGADAATATSSDGSGNGSGSDGTGSSGSSGTSTGDRCSLPKVVGSCEAHFESYWFNAGTEKCEAFVYGGCEGNANRFETPGECVAACAPSAEVDPCSAIVCESGKVCVYQGPTPVCAEPCQEGSACREAPTLSCKCAGSCANCKDCRNVCLP